MLKCMHSTVNKSLCSLLSWLDSLNGTSACKAQGCAGCTVICCNPDFIMPVPQLGWRIIQSISKCAILEGDVILDQILAQRLCHLHCIGTKSTELLWCYNTCLKCNAQNSMFQSCNMAWLRHPSMTSLMFQLCLTFSMKHWWVHKPEQCHTWLGTMYLDIQSDSWNIHNVDCSILRCRCFTLHTLSTWSVCCKPLSRAVVGTGARSIC